MKSFALMVLALALVVVLFVPCLVLQTLRHIVMCKSLSDLWFTVAIGLDQLGGSVIYGEVDWTVSSCTGFYAMKGNPYAKVFEKLINLMFGKDHCINSYMWERDKNKEGLK